MSEPVIRPFRSQARFARLLRRFVQRPPQQRDVCHAVTAALRENAVDDGLARDSREASSCHDTTQGYNIPLGYTIQLGACS
jgi:hypothetical protein